MRLAEWTTPEELLRQLERLWERGVLLQGAGGDPSESNGTPMAREGASDAAGRYPLRLRLRRPSSRELGERFDEVRAWVRALEVGSQKYGYAVEYEEVAHRQLGKNRIPAKVSIETEAEALRILGKTRAAERYRRLVEEIRGEFPTLVGWLERKALTAIEVGEKWPRILAVLRWFQEHPRPGLYRRQLEIEGVDTKFIEENRKVLGELLPLVLAPEHVLDAPRMTFDRRFGLEEKPLLVRFRLLDEAQYIHGLSDLTVPVHDLARLDLPVDEVIVTENEVNGLALPPRPRTVVIFGQGYANERLAEVAWLRARRLLYWGDIDTHGFVMLDRFRSHFPDAESLLMDAETFHAHRPMWVPEASPRAEALTRLSDAEARLFGELVRGIHGDRLRLEQERIGFAWVRRALGLATPPTTTPAREAPSASSARPSDRPPPTPGGSP